MTLLLHCHNNIVKATTQTRRVHPRVTFCDYHETLYYRARYFGVLKLHYFSYLAAKFAFVFNTNYVQNVKVVVKHSSKIRTSFTLTKVSETFFTCINFLSEWIILAFINNNNNNTIYELD